MITSPDPQSFSRAVYLMRVVVLIMTVALLPVGVTWILTGIEPSEQLTFLMEIW